MAPPSLCLSEPLSSFVGSKYASAQACGALTFSSTHLAIIRVNGIPFQLRWCPALAHKPTGKESGTEQRQGGQAPPNPKKFNPFENPSVELLVTSVPAVKPTHNVVLNKYPVIAQHFILATKKYKEQTDKLEDEDLAMTYACLREWGPGRLFAFFNSGERSGASQGHRHIQFLPVEQVHSDEGGGKWAPLIDMMHETGIQAQASNNSPTVRSLPFTHFSLPIPDDASTSQLSTSYNTLYETAVDALRSSYPEMILPSGAPEARANATVISYNLAITTSRMAICPRRSETSMIDQGNGNTNPGRRRQIGPVALNGTLLAGTVMVKTEEEWNALRGDEGETRLNKILVDVGVPKKECHQAGENT